MALFDFNFNLRLPPEFFTAVDKLVTAINTKGNQIMATFQEVKDAVTGLVAKVDENTTEISEAVVILGEVKAKLDELIAGGGATPEQLQELKDALEPATTKITDATAALDTAGQAADITP